MPFTLAIVTVCGVVTSLVDAHVITVAGTLAMSAIGIFVARIFVVFASTVGVGLLRGSAVVVVVDIGIVVIEITLLLLLLGFSFGCADLGVLLCYFNVRYNVKGVIKACLSVKLAFSEFRPACAEMRNETGPFLVWNIGPFES